MASLPELSRNITLGADWVMDHLSITDTPSLIRFLKMCSLHSALKAVEYITKMDDGAAITTWNQATCTSNLVSLSHHSVSLCVHVCLLYSILTI